MSRYSEYRIIIASAPSTLPRITIITPSFNQGRYIEQAICSVLDQGYPNLEYLVIDCGSTDETLDVLQRYDGALTWISEQDRWPAHAINKGLKRARGDIVAFLNLDEPAKLPDSACSKLYLPTGYLLA